MRDRSALPHRPNPKHKLAGSCLGLPLSIAPLAELFSVRFRRNGEARLGVARNARPDFSTPLVVGGNRPGVTANSPGRFLFPSPHRNVNQNGRCTYARPVPKPTPPFRLSWLQSRPPGRFPAGRFVVGRE